MSLLDFRLDLMVVSADQPPGDVPPMMNKPGFTAWGENPENDAPAYESPRPASGLLTASFDYELPEPFIAQVPAEPRDSAKLFDATGEGLGSDRWTHRRVSDLAEVLRPGDALIVNETFVIPARLELRKETGGAVEVLLLDPLNEPGAWAALIKPAKRLKPGVRLKYSVATWPARNLITASRAILWSWQRGQGKRMSR